MTPGYLGRSLFVAVLLAFSHLGEARAADNIAPSVPTGLTATAASCSQVNLACSASTDSGGSGLAGYKVFRNGVQVATTASTSYSNTGLVGSTSYLYRVAAYDNAGNTSAQSTVASATTPAC